MMDTNPVNKETLAIYIILNELDPYETNILLSFYELADCSPSKLSRILGVSPSVICNRLNKINKYIKSRTDAITKTMPQIN